MSIKTYRARNMREAIDQIRLELGPEASVLHTRELNRGLLSRLMWGRQIEVAASATVDVPRRFNETAEALAAPDAGEQAPAARGPEAAPSTPRQAPQPCAAAPLDVDYRARYREAVRMQFSPELDELQHRVQEIYQGAPSDTACPASLPDAYFRAFTDLLEAGIDEAICRTLLEEARGRLPDADAPGYQSLKESLHAVIAAQLPTSGGIRVTPGERRVVALVGPTGVGKTTTIAKLAANFRLRDKQRVGLVTVDTYRVAAVEQLRTYADIIDLPMEVVSTPREMREAMDRLSDLDLVLVDTAGRSPRDQVKIQELKSMLGEASADEVTLVLSCTTGARNLLTTARQFAPAGVTSLLYTKLDEATELGCLLPCTQESGLPISYVTDGQNVPDDIQVADASRLAQRVMEVQA